MTASRRALAAALSIALAGPAAHADPTGPGAPAPVVTANAAARVQPRLDAFQGAVQRFSWSEGGLYQVYAAPGRVTDIVLEPGEQLAGPGPIAAGDTARWVLGDTESGVGPQRRVHVMVKPTQANLATNLVINTDRRTYYLELRATTATYMASVAWTYPKDALIALARPVVAPSAPEPAKPAPEPQPAPLNFDYAISGDRVGWRPQLAYDDGARVHLVFPASVAAGELPPLFVLDEAGRPTLANTRLEGRQIIVDRLFDRAELRLGDKRALRRVRIERRGSPAP